jgi:hypothetical protein
MRNKNKERRQDGSATFISAADTPAAAFTYSGPFEHQNPIAIQINLLVLC